jgi:hypothetical protein
MQQVRLIISHASQNETFPIYWWEMKFYSIIRYVIEKPNNIFSETSFILLPENQYNRNTEYAVSL